jgi:hypothetical protein
MIPGLRSVSRTRRQWLTAASIFRECHPELAAKITLARLSARSDQQDEPLAIAFTRAEYDWLEARLPAEWTLTGKPGTDQGGDETARTIADVEAFLRHRSDD